MSRRTTQASDYVFGPNSGPAAVVRSDGFDSLLDIMRGTDAGMGSRVAHPYEKSVYCFTAIGNIAESIGGLEVRLFTAGDEPITNPTHDYVRLAAQPNPEQTGDEFIYATCVHFEIDGIVFWVEPEYEPGKATPRREIFVASKSEMEPMETGGDLIGWRYTPQDGGKTHTLPLTHVRVLRRYHPRKRLEGIAPASVARMAIEGHYSALALFQSAVKNGAEVGAVFTTDQHLSEQQHAEALKIIRSRYAGEANANKPLLLSGGVKVDRGSQGLNDISWLEGMGVAANIIATAYNVPLLYVNLMDQAQYNSAPVQERVFWTMNGLPKRRRIMRAMNDFFLRGDATRYYYDLDISGVQVLQEETAAFMAKVFALTAHNISRNEINRRFDLGFEEPAYAEVPLVGAGQIPMDVLVGEAKAAMGFEEGPEGGGSTPLTTPDGDEPGDGSTPTPDVDEKPEDKSARRIVARLDRVIATATQAIYAAQEDAARSATTAAVHARWVKSWHGLRRACQVRISKFFRRQEKEMLARLKSVTLPYEPGTKADVARDAIDQVIEVIAFDVEAENEKLSAVMRPPIHDGLELGGKQVAKELGGFDFDIENPNVIGHLKEQAIRVQDVNAATIQRIRKTLTGGMESGETLSELADRISKVLGDQASWRGYVIAQTEMHEAISAGRQEGMSQAGIDGKAWLTSGRPVKTLLNPGGVVRLAHAHAESASKDGIGLDEKFVLFNREARGQEVARELAMYPGDATLSAGNRINCSCVSVARKLKGGKSVNADDLVGRYTYADMLSDRDGGKS